MPPMPFALRRQLAADEFRPLRAACLQAFVAEDFDAFTCALLADEPPAP